MECWILPRRVDHAINSIFGGVGSDLVGLLGRGDKDLIDRDAEKRAIETARYVVPIGAFTSMVDVRPAVLSALTALACAMAGLGVWTLVAAPFVALATAAGAIYGLAYRRSGSLLAPAHCHTGVDLIWHINNQR